MKRIFFTNPLGTIFSVLFALLILPVSAAPVFAAPVSDAPVSDAPMQEPSGQRFVYGLAQYEQNVVLEFATPEEAQAAELTKLEMPVGKTLAVSGRWDDSSGEHYFMSKTMAENGWKGTFFLNKCDENYVKKIVSQIIADGNSIGVHTLRHPHLEQVVPNRMFEEILGNRIDLESKTDQCASTFTFPFGLGRDTEASLTTAAEQGAVLKRCGLLGGPETINMAERMGLKPEEFVSPYRFVADDRNPNLETFEKGWKNGIAQIEAGRSTVGPYMALGTHSWQRHTHKDGFERLSRILATQSGKKEIWYCTCNEFTAWRLNYVWAEVSEKKVVGNRAEFTIRRFEPQELGAVVDLGLKAVPTPQKAECACGKTLEITANGEFMLPNAPGQTLPEKIDRIDNLTNAPADQAAESAEFPGLRIGAQMDMEKNVLTVFLANETGKTLTDVKGQVRLPLKWKGEKPNWFVEKIESGSQVLLTLDPGEMETEARFGTYDLLIDVQCDFRLDEQTGRIHSTVTVTQPAP